MQLRQEVAQVATKSQEETQAYTESLMVREMEVKQLQARIEEAKEEVCLYVYACMYVDVRVCVCMCVSE